MEQKDEIQQAIIDLLDKANNKLDYEDFAEIGLYITEYIDDIANDKRDRQGR